MSDPSRSISELRRAVTRRIWYRRLRVGATGLLAMAALGSVGYVLLRSGPTEPVAREEAETASTDAVVILDAEEQRNAGISVATVESRLRTDHEEAPAVLTLDETRTARIGSIVDGIVTETLADVGSRVSAGDLLGTIHSRVVHDSWADYTKAIAERRRQQTELAYAEQSAGRAQRLYDAKAVSAQQLERANADRAATEELLAMATAEVTRAAEDLEHYGIVVDAQPTIEVSEQIPVRTPLSGVVLERLVTPGTAVTMGTAMFVVSDLSSLWAAAEIDETRLSQVTIGHSVEVRVSAYPTRSFTGTTTFIGDVINPRTRRVTVRSTLPNPEGLLKAEMFATVELGQGDPHEVAVVPAEAIQEIDGQPVVFVLGATNTFRPQPVEVGPDLEGWVEIRSGVRPGERIAATGSFALKSELLGEALLEGN